MMFSFSRFLVISSSYLFVLTFVHAADIDPLALITANVNHVCTSPENAGSQWDIRIRSGGEAAVKLKLSDDIGVTGRTEFTANEWSEVRTTVEDSASPEECSEALVPLFTERFTSLIEKLMPQEEKPSRSLGGMTWLDFQGGVDLTLLDCDVKSETVTCTFVGNSLDEDLELDIYGESAIYDHQGRKYYLTYAEIANFKDNVMPESSNHSITADLVKGVDTPIRLRFQEITNDVLAISKIAIAARIRTNSGGAKHMFDFRDVDISLK